MWVCRTCAAVTDGWDPKQRGCWVEGEVNLGMQCCKNGKAEIEMITGRWNKKRCWENLRKIKWCRRRGPAQALCKSRTPSKLPCWIWYASRAHGHTTAKCPVCIIIRWYCCTRASAPHCNKGNTMQPMGVGIKRLCLLTRLSIW